MFLFEIIIKELINYSNNLFIVIIITVFGYYGWLLINSYNMIKSCVKHSQKHIDEIQIIKDKLDKVEKNINQDLRENIKENGILNNLKNEIEDSNDDRERSYDKIIAEINEESDEIKETVKILLTLTIVNGFHNGAFQDIGDIDINEINSILNNNKTNCDKLNE